AIVYQVGNVVDEYAATYSMLKSRVSRASSRAATAIAVSAEKAYAACVPLATRPRSRRSAPPRLATTPHSAVSHPKTIARRPISLIHRSGIAGRGEDRSSPASRDVLQASFSNVLERARPTFNSHLRAAVAATSLRLRRCVSPLRTSKD